MFQDAFLPILDATNVTELREAVHDSIKQCLPKVVSQQLLTVLIFKSEVFYLCYLVLFSSAYKVNAIMMA